MIAFGVAISNRDLYERIALPGMRRAAEPDSVILTREGYDSIQEPYNEILDEAAGLVDLEALVLIHQDAELTDESLAARVRPVLQGDPAVGLVGPLGWRSGESDDDAREPDRVPGLRLAAFHGESAGLPKDRFGLGDRHYSSGSHRVDVLDGVLLVLAPWVVSAVRFDRDLARLFHGYDLDFCMRVRAAGGRIVCNDIPYAHHMARPWRSREDFTRAKVELTRKWDPDVRPAEWAPSFRR